MNNCKNSFSGKRWLGTLFLSLLCKIGTGQKQWDNWFFSSYNGISFFTGLPVNIPGGGKIGVMEGAAAMSDKNGNLLFYTDGITVWTNLHSIMSNGTGLGGGYGSSTQSSIIVPKGSSEKEFYIFTTDEEGGPAGLQYSIVDMTGNMGQGRLVAKNVQLVTPTCEKITAIRHCNGIDYWIITHKYNSGDFYVYRASETGIDPVPVISTIGKFIPAGYGNMAGALKSSPDGSILASATVPLGIEIFDFNNQTGIISNPTEIYAGGGGMGSAYSLEFSGNSKILYSGVSYYFDMMALNYRSGVFQYNLDLAIRTDIILSRNQGYAYVNPIEVGTMQRGPDGKIYMAQYRQNHLGVINRPEVYGNGCDYNVNGFLLSSTGNFSLPNLVNQFPEDDEFLLASRTCVGNPVEFRYPGAGGVLSLIWDFGDPLSGTNNSSSLADPSHVYQDEGTYLVKLILNTRCGAKLLTKQISVNAVRADLGQDIALCEKSTVILDPHSQISNSFLWQDGATSPTYEAEAPGLYWVEVTDKSTGCSKKDEIIISKKPLPTVFLGNDTTLCEGAILLLDAQNAGGTFLWKNNSTDQLINVNEKGIYWVDVTVAGCTTRDSIEVTYTSKPRFSLGNDLYLCPDNPIKLSIDLSNAQFLWHDGSTNPEYEVKKPGYYYVDATNFCGTTRDSITILPGICDVKVPNVFSPNSDGLNDYFRILGSEQITEFSMKVYNRWGQITFSTNNKEKGWDGRQGSMDCPQGNYVYLIRFRLLNQAAFTTLKGVVILMR